MVTKYEKDDIKKIIELGLQLNPKFDNLFNVDNLPSSENILVYKEGTTVIGFIQYLNNIDTVEILNLIVVKERRKQSIASLMIKELINTNNKRMILEVRESNIAAIKLYQKFDFNIINIRNKYYENENGVVMERSNK